MKKAYNTIGNWNVDSPDRIVENAYRYITTNGDSWNANTKRTSLQCISGMMKGEGKVPSACGHEILKLFTNEFNVQQQRY